MRYVLEMMTAWRVATVAVQTIYSLSDGITPTTLGNTHCACITRAFIRFIRGGGWLLAVFRRAFSYRQRWGLDMAQCAIPL